MPYIKKEDRVELDELIEEIIKKVDTTIITNTEGQLNYLISSIINKIYEPSYFNYNRAIGLIECIKQEFYRRPVARYEDKKMLENGDI